MLHLFKGRNTLDIKKKSSVRISIITVTYNCVDTLGRTLDSLAKQEYDNIETIWIDGDSRDGTKEILASRFNLKNGAFVSSPDGGIYEAMNNGINLATGDIIGFLHADDLYPDDYVLSKIAKIFENPEVDAIYGDLVYIKRDNPLKIVRYWQSGDFERKNLKLGWMPPHPTLYLRSYLYKKIGVFDERYRISADYDFILRLFSDKELKFIHLPEVIVKMSVGGQSNKSIRNILLKIYEDCLVMRRNKINFLQALFFKNFSKIPQLIFNNDEKHLNRSADDLI